MRSIIIFIALAIISQYNVFGSSFYDDEYDFQRRADAASTILTGENLIMNVATPDQLTQIEKLLPACLALSNGDLQRLFQAYLDSHPARRRKRSLDLLRRFESNLYEDEQDEFERRASTDAQKKVIADDVSKLLKKLDQESLNDLSERVRIATGGGVAGEKQFLLSVVGFASECGKKAARRLLEVRNFLEEQMLNEYN